MEAIAVAVAATGAEKHALGLLARAEQSRFLLSGKLERRGCTTKAINLALDFLESEGLLDDRRFAEAWLRSRVGKASLSPSKLALGLRNRGIEEGVVKTAFAMVFDAEKRRDLLKRAAERELKLADGDIEVARTALRRLGFKSGEIRAFFEETQ